MKRFKIFFYNSLLMIFTSLVLQIIKLIFHIYISNKISTEALGVFQLIMVTYAFGITLASSGINIACTRVISEELAIGNDFGVKKASKQCIKISLIISLIASFIFYLGSDFIVKYCFESKVSERIVHLICIALPLISVTSAISGYFVAVRRVSKTVLGQFLEQFSKILAIIILFKTYSTQGHLEGICFALILGDVISEFIAFTYSIVIYLLDVNNKFAQIETTYKNNFLHRIFRILIPVSLTSYIKSGLSTLKQLIIPTSLRKNGKNPSEALSDYGIVSGMAMPIIMFPASFLIAVAGLLIPEFARFHVKEDYAKIKLYTDKLLIGSFLFSLLLTSFFWTFGDALGLAIYHNQEVGLYIKLFSLLIPFMYVDIIIDNILKGLDAQTNVMVINIVDLIVSTLFIFIFVPILGIKGYILSIFISEILNLTLSLNKLLKLEKSWEVI